MNVTHLGWIPAGAGAGYGDFRSRMIIPPNIGSTIGAAPTLVSTESVEAPGHPPEAGRQGGLRQGS